MTIVGDGFSNYSVMLARRTALAAALRPGNKIAPFTPLAATGVATVNVEFDDACESGQIQAIIADFRLRALRHHAERIFGVTIANGASPVRLIGEQHCLVDLCFIPSFADWGRGIGPEPWMGRRGIGGWRRSRC